MYLIEAVELPVASYNNQDEESAPQNCFDSGLTLSRASSTYFEHKLFTTQSSLPFNIFKGLLNPI